MSFAEVEKYRMWQRVSEPLRQMELERCRVLKEAEAWEAEQLPILVRHPPWRERFGALLQGKPSTRVSSGASGA